MNDNDYPPAWVETILDRQDLWIRSDTPLGAATVLLTDTAFDLKALGETVFSESALTSTSLDQLKVLIVRLQDAVALAELCPRLATPSRVTVTPTGIHREPLPVRTLST